MCMGYFTFSVREQLSQAYWKVDKMGVCISLALEAREVDVFAPQYTCILNAIKPAPGKDIKIFEKNGSVKV